MRRLSQAILPLLIFAACSGAFGADLRTEIRVAQSSGDFERAAGLYRQLIASGEDTPEARSNLAAMLHFSGHDPEALQQARSALKRDPDLVGANLIAGMALSRLNRPAEAIPYLDRAHRQDTRGAAPLIALGQAYVSLRDYPRSNAAYRQATELDPGNADAWYGLGITFRSLADAAIKKSSRGTIPPQAERWLDSARSALTRAIALQPDSPRAHLILAESYRDSGKFTDAVNEYQTVMRISPNDPAAELGLATTYWKSGEVDHAVPLLEKVLHKLPKDPEANGIMAEILVRKGEFQSAAPFANTALAGNPQLLQVRFALAKIYLAAKRPEPAIAELEKAAPGDPDGSYHFLLHRALKMAGRDQEAEAALAQFKRLRKASRAGAPE